MFQTVSLSLYRKAEFISFVKDYLTVLDKYDTTTVAEKVTALKEAYKSITDDYQQPISSDYTASIQELDRKRDACLVGIRTVLNGYAFHYDTELRAAANAILKSMDKYGKNIQRMDYRSQTVILENLIQDWDAPEFKTHLKNLYLEDWAKQMKTDNEAFAALRQARSEERAANVSESMEVHRPAVIEAYRALNTLIAAHQTIATAENWTKIIAEHNAIATEYETQLSRRTAKKVEIKE